MASAHGDVPPSFLCPISSEVMVDPVIVVGSSQTASRAAVTRWFASGSTRCPVTNVQLRTPLMIPNHALATAVQEWKASGGKCIPSGFICPLSKQTMVDPVTIVESRQTIDQCSAAKWIQSGKYRCPVSKVWIRKRGFIPNYALKNACEEWKEILEKRMDKTSPACDAGVNAFQEALEIEPAGQIMYANSDEETPRNRRQRQRGLIAACIITCLALFGTVLLITFLGLKSTRQGPEASREASREPSQKEVVRGKTTFLHNSKLLEAAKNGDAKAVQILVNEGADVNTFDSNRRTPIIFAAFHGYSKIVSILLDRGADPNAEDIHGETALMLAVDYENFEVVQILISGGSNINTPSAFGWTPLTYAVMSVIRHLNASPKAEGMKIIEALITAGADLEAHGDDGWTPLIWAATEDDKDVVKLLINSGAQVAASTIKTVGEVPSLSTGLHVAANYGCIKVAKILLLANADKHVKNSEGKTAKEMVCQHCPERTRLLKVLE